MANPLENIAISILVATAGAVIAYVSAIAAESRRRRLDRIDQQIRELYGPLLILAITNDGAWIAFEKSAENMPGSLDQYYSRFWRMETPEQTHWRNWVEHVFTPLNDEMTQTIKKHAHLVDGRSFPETFAVLAGHLGGVKAMVAEWNAGQFNLFGPPERYPKALRKDVEDAFNRCLRRQSDLLRGGLLGL